jgi:hypothetical protein
MCLFQHGDVEEKEGTESVQVLTTEAPSPRTALRAKSGTGSHDGRPITFPNCSHISANRTGFGAVPLMTPEVRSIEPSSIIARLYIEVSIGSCPNKRQHYHGKKLI